MKVRLYRGPADGRIIRIPDHETTWLVESLAEDPMDTYKTLGDVRVNTVKSMYYRTRHTHPDGSVYFEWSRPRGTKSGVRPKRPNKKQKFVVNYVGIPTGTMYTTTSSSANYIV